VNGDARRLQQIVANLLQNALKFTPPQGQIEVSARRLNGLLEVAVADTGIGIDAALLPHIFERFFQDGSSKTREYGGLGLGLSIVKHLVTAHGGSVQAYSEGRGRGARFILRLPITEQVTSTPQQLTEPPLLNDTLRGMRLLVVDDEIGGREALCEVLKMAGAETISVGSAAAALVEFGARKFDAVLSDVAMPGVDGHQLAREIRERERDLNWPRTFMVALTGFTTLRERDDALAAGFDEHLGKPLDLAQLISRLKGIVVSP
jgi:two-component system CheB/CheR fusion protein